MKTSIGASIESPNGFPLTDIIENIKGHKHTLVTGPPGTGKSKLLLDLYDRLLAERVPVVKLAPTHSASKRINGKTIHSFFQINPYDERMKFTGFSGIIIIDEISMVPRSLFDVLFAHLNTRSVFVLFGDFCQLPPVSNNSTFSIEDLANTFRDNMKYERDDILSCIDIYSRIKNFIFTSSFFQQLHIIRLTHVYRTKNADLLDLYIAARNGDLVFDDMSIKIAKSEDLLSQHHISCVFDILSDIKVDIDYNSTLLSKYRSSESDGIVMLPCLEEFRDTVILASTYSCIDALYKALNLEYVHISKTETIDNETKDASRDASKDASTVYYNKLYFYPSQRVKIVEKTSGIAKYTIGVILGYDEEADAMVVACPTEDHATVQTKDEIRLTEGGPDEIRLTAYKIYKVKKITIKQKIVNYPFQPLDMMSIHKAQGQEFSTVIVVVDNLFELGHFYTAITRAKEKLILAYLSKKNIKTKGFNRTIYNTQEVNINVSEVI